MRNRGKFGGGVCDTLDLYSVGGFLFYFTLLGFGYGQIR